MNGAEENAAGEAKAKKSQETKEGRFLLGSPTFVDIGKGRWRCAESGHELLAIDKESYARSKACRLALINAALARRKPPLNTFQAHPHFKSKLVCSLTGDTINKSEEHIWTHINGRKFLKKLEEKEIEASLEKAEKDGKNARKKSKMKAFAIHEDPNIGDNGNGSPVREPLTESFDSEEPNFWIPPAGDRWDFDDGRDRWESCDNSHQETKANNSIGSGACLILYSALNVVIEKNEAEAKDLHMRKKRMAVAVSFATRRKKIKKALKDNKLSL